MCEQRQYVAYPSISQGAPPIEIQTEIVNAFLAKAPPIDLRKYFFTYVYTCVHKLIMTVGVQSMATRID